MLKRHSRHSVINKMAIGLITNINNAPTPCYRMAVALGGGGKSTISTRL